MTIPIIATVLYGIIVLLGGVMGYVKAKSKPSLISGLVSGILLIISAILQLQGIPLGLTLAQVLTAILIVVFTVRLIKTRKFIPAGLMLMLGVLALVMTIN